MPKARIPKTEAHATASDRVTMRGWEGASVTEGQVARRAYDLYLARGREDGHDIEDWLQAERELRGANQ